MQLFSIGLWQLHMDGTQKLDGGRTASPELRPEDLDNSYDLVSQAV